MARPTPPRNTNKCVEGKQNNKKEPNELLSRNEVHQTFRARYTPGSGLLLDLRNDKAGEVRGVTENSRVTLIPKLPSGKSNHGGDSLPRCPLMRHRSRPTVKDRAETLPPVWKQIRGPNPQSNRVPYAGREPTMEEKVNPAQGRIPTVRPSTLLQTIPHPYPILNGHPREELAF